MLRRNFGKYLITFLVFLLFTPVFVNHKATAHSIQKNEMRAAWISTVINIDMKAGMSETQYTQWAQSTLDKLKADNFNTVIFQVKPLQDALYPSKLAPWSSYITGKKQGTNPGFDPLQIMLNEAHKRGLELHAWVNPYRVTMASQTLANLAADNVAIKNPSWVVKYGKQYYLNPGLPEVQNYLESTIKELVSNYDIDAIHMDDYFYPYKIKGETFQDQQTFKKYGSSFNKIEDWRRDNVTQLVKKVYASINEMKPHIQYGISPFGIWRNKRQDSTGSNTDGMSNYDDIYADTRQWLKDGSIDYIAPQIYWSRNYKVASYSVLLDWWGKEVQTYATAHPVNLYIGMADYKVGNDADTAWNNKTELTSQIIDNRANKNVQGQMHFSLRSINKNALGYASYLNQQLYTYKALTPTTPWKDSTVPMNPTDVLLSQESSGMKLTITDKNSTQPRKYVIYRFDGSTEGSYEDVKNIVDVVYNTKGNTVYVDTTANKNKVYTYGIKSISATGVESKTAFVLTDGKPSLPTPGEPEQPEKPIDPNPSIPFNDISTNWAKDMIEDIAARGIIAGYPDGTFRPNEKIKRQHIAVMLARAIKLTPIRKPVSFSDVPTSHPYYEAITRLQQAGIVDGSNGAFGPNESLTRAQLAKILVLAFGITPGGTSTFQDVPTTYWSFDYIAALADHGIALGDNGHFRPNEPVTRAQFVAFMYRAMNK